MKDKETVIKSLEACAIHEDCNRCAYDSPGLGTACVNGLMRDAWLLLVQKTPTQAPRLMTAEEVRNLTAGTPVVMERLLHDGTGEDPYLTIKVWGVCSVSGKLFISYDGTIYPDTVKEIPYRTICTRRDNGEQECRLYRFWTGKPTDEQSKAIPWEAGGQDNGRHKADR